ncbi:glycosyltransferase family 4 protein [Schlesneria sp. T3-172]|uniref:glycosyltransferase family 4 protein n=1 Tax=Schlesneria sphaerica TaxID=3373610 RepID=UPI0037C7D8BF
MPHSREDRLHLGVIGARGIGALQGGIERYCSEFYRHLPADRFKITIFVRKPSKGLEDCKNINLVRIPILKSSSLETPLYSMMAVLTAYAMGVKVIHVHGLSSCLPLPLARLLGLRIIVRHMGAEYDRVKWNFLARRILKLGEYFCARYAESVVCLNSDIAEKFAAATGRRDSVVIPNGVSPPCDEAAEKLPENLAISPDSYALAVGRFVPEKNFHQLISAFLTARLPSSAKLVLAGEPDYPGPYARLIESLCQGHEDRILRAGVVCGDELVALYRHTRLFVLPSSHEGMSFSLLEAGISGARLVVSDIPSNKEVCQNFGRLFPVDSEDGLRDALEQEWVRPHSQRDVDAQIAEFRRRFDWRQVASATAPLLAGSSRVLKQSEVELVQPEFPQSADAKEPAREGV